MKSQPNFATLHMSTHKNKASFTWNALFHITPGQAQLLRPSSQHIAHVGPAPSLNTVDLSVLHHKGPYVNGLWGKFIFI